MDDVYLSLKELCARIKYKPQTIYNNINKGVFVLGRHYLKPTKRKLLFKLSAILEWLGEDTRSSDISPLVNCDTAMLVKSDNDSQHQKPKSKIKI